MSKSNKDKAIEVRYDAYEDQTSEFLDYAIINADIANKIPFKKDRILEIRPFFSYKGKERTGETNVSFYITEYSGSPTEPTNKIVFLIDGEQLEVDSRNDQLGKKGKFSFTPESIIGIGRVALPTSIRTIEFSLSNNDIKRIADSNDVSVFLDPTTPDDANGGTFKFRNIKGNFQIEGIQGAMKRAYHYFVDENYYVDYCASFLERKHKILEEEKLRIEKEKQKREQQRIQQEQLRMQQEQERILLEQEEQKNVERKDKKFLRALIILIASIVLFIIGLIFVNITLLLISCVVGVVCLIVMMAANDDFYNLIEQMTRNHNGNQGN